MDLKNTRLNQFFDLVNFYKKNQFQFIPYVKEDINNKIDFYKKGYKIKIKKENRGKFTDYCGGKVTSECIQKGKNSPNPKIRRRATFADNSRKWKHSNGGSLIFSNTRLINFNEYSK